MLRPTRRSVLLAILGAALGFHLFRALYYSRWMDDDAFISFRYARNLVRGLGLVFNPGEHVEGYSNFLWTVLLAGANGLGMPLPEASRALGVALSLATGLLLLVPSLRVLPRRGESIEAPFFVGLIAPVALWMTDSWAVWAVGGLEGPLGAFLVTGALLCYSRSLRSVDPSAEVWWAGLLAALAALAHPSLAIFGLVLGAHALWLAARTRRFARLLALAAPALVLGAPYLVWKLAYYGDALPNTYHAKFEFASALVGRGFRYLVDSVAGLPAVTAVALATSAVLLILKDRDPRPWLMLAGIAGYGAYAVAIGGEAFPAYRLLMVLLPISCVLLQYAVASLIAVKPAATSMARMVAALAILGFAGANFSTARVRVLDEAIRSDALAQFRAIGLELKRRLSPGALLAYSGAGVIPFYSELRFLDTLGLTDRHIASQPARHVGQGMAGHEKGDGAYVFARRPDVIMLSGPSFEPFFPGDREMLAIPEFERVYERRTMTIRFRPSGATEEITVPVPMFVRRDLPHF